MRATKEKSMVLFVPERQTNASEQKNDALNLHRSHEFQNEIGGVRMRKERG
jgi:hypothetical protein